MAPNKKQKAPASKEDTTEGKQKALKPATSINVRHILCTKHSAHETALATLQSGQPFDTVARAHSEDKARQGGSLGWKPRKTLLPEFENIAYGLEVSSVSKPKWGTVKTSEGYHLIMVEGRK